MTPEILGIIGFLAVLALSVNAYFIKSLVESIEQVKVQTATLLEKSLNSEDEIHILRERLHRLGNDTHNKLMRLELKIAELSKKP